MNAITKNDIGRVGRDQYGVRFAVIDPCDLGLASPARAEDVEDEGATTVLVLAGTRNRAPGAMLHVSWLDLPIEWESELSGSSSTSVYPVKEKR